MKAEFNNLVETLKRWDLYHIGDEVDMALTDLSDKIEEVEKRMVCIEKCAEEINEAFSKVDKKVAE
jgi:chaperonin cofactor prefoldin